ncbi:hypothetical protein H0H93_005288 [Arthromyces matolae]|nr:hypothetical protein H0H93_005288 [Arthromyces matolae]
MSDEKFHDTKLTVDDGKLENASEEASQVRELEDSEEERRLVWKLDRRILPIACLLYLFAYLDRSNLGNARLQGLDKDILGGDPTGVLFDWINSVFFFSYVSSVCVMRPRLGIKEHACQILCQIPATVISKLFPPRVWMASSALGWGLSSSLMVSISSPLGGHVR